LEAARVSPLLLDTCAAIWLAEGETLSDEAKEALASSTAAGVEVLISPVTAWEVGMLAAKGRLNMPLAPLAWFESLLALPLMAAAELSPRVLVASSFLPGTPPTDPMDRIVIATAREKGYRVLTRDKMMLGYARQGHLSAIAC
jgi:PIN domain nuclease of toxin-antitoxin system